MACIFFSASVSFCCQGLSLVSRCSQLMGGWLPAAETPLLQGRPGHGNLPAIGPVARVGLVWWQKQGPQQGSRAELRLDAVPASYPREVLRGERPKRVLVPFDRAKGTPSGKRPHQAGKPERWAVRRAASQSGIIYIRNKRNTPPRAGTACPLIPQVSECEWSPSPHPPLPPWCTGCAALPPP